MKMISNLLVLFLMMSVTTSAIAQDKGEEWDLKEYAEMWKSHQKIYVYSSGEFIVTNDELKDSKDVVLLLLNATEKKYKTGEGKLSKEMVKEVLSGLEAFSPAKKAMVPPCCPQYDKDGNLLRYVYTNSCVWPCYKPFRRKNSNFKLNCCPPHMAKMDFNPR